MTQTFRDDRAESLALYRILDTPPERAFDRIVGLAAGIFDVPVSTIGFLDGDRMWFKARIGLEAEQVEALPGLCVSVLEGDGPYVVEDAATDPRSAGHPLVTGPPGVRFYAGVPIGGADGPGLGALCVVDRAPRRPRPEQLEALQALGELVEELLAARIAYRQQEERRQSQVEMAEALPHMVWTARPDGVLDYMSAEFRRSTGLREVELERHGWLDVVHPDDRERIVARRSAAIAAGRPFANEFRMWHVETGDYRWYLCATRPHRDSAGRIVKWYGSGIDIHDRRRAEEELRAALDRNRLILDSSGEGINGLDAAGNVVFVNAAALEMLGYAEHEVLGRSGHAQMHHHPAEGASCPVEGCPIHLTLRDGVTRRVRDEVFIRKDGSAFPAEYTVAAMIDPAAGAVTGAVVNFRDVSAQRREAELRALEARTLGSISAGAALREILEEVTRTVDRLLPPVRASVLLIDDEGRLRSGAAPGLPAAFNAAVEGIAIGEGVGACGTAAFRCEQVITSDIMRDPLWEGYRPLAEQHGLRACWSTPVIGADGRVLATFALYYDAPRAPESEELEVIARVARFVRVAVERTRERAELQRSEARYRSVFSLVPVSIWEEDWSGLVRRLDELRAAGVTDLRDHLEGHPGLVEELLAAIRVVDVNDATLAMFEADSKADILAGMETIFGGAAMRRRLIDELVAIWQGRPVYELEIGLRTLRGRPLQGVASFALPPPGSGSGRVLICIMDITERKAAEERFRVVAQATTDIVWDWNPQTGALWWNDGIETILGYDRAATRTDYDWWRAGVHPDDRERVEAGLLAAVEGPGDKWSDEYRFARADGDWIEVVDQGIVIRDESGRPLRMVGSMVDVTERRRLEEQLRQSQRLDAVGQLTGGVAHDFNNLLTVILGNAEVLSESLGDEPRLRALAEMTARAAERGAELTNRLLAFARRQPLDPRPTDVNRRIADMDDLLRRSLGEHIEIETVRAGGLWFAMVDGAQLESALLNLCLNARDAMPGGGRLTIETANAHLDASYAAQEDDVAPGQYVLVAVSDNGQGMAQETLGRAFEPFFTTKEVGKGSGLGLSTVYGFAKQSKGHVRIYSEPGEGTTVKLYLPRAYAERAEDADGRDAPVKAGCERILLVEDEDLVREHVAGQLADLGYRVVAARDGPEALALLRRDRGFDLLFTDVVMPGGMSGRELADAVRELAPALPVLFTSGYTENAIVHHGRLDPGVHLLLKPYRRQELAVRLRRILDEAARAEAG